MRDMHGYFVRYVLCEMYERYVRWWRSYGRATRKIIVMACVAFQEERFCKSVEMCLGIWRYGQQDRCICWI